MASIHLDTSFLIRALVPGSDPDRLLRRWIEEGQQVAMSSVAWSEFMCGPLDVTERQLAEGIVPQRLPFDEHDGVSAPEFFNETGRRRGSLIDCMIAASAHRRGASIATLNHDDFRRFETLGLGLAN